MSISVATRQHIKELNIIKDEINNGTSIREIDTKYPDLYLKWKHNIRTMWCIKNKDIKVKKPVIKRYSREKALCSGYITVKYEKGILKNYLGDNKIILEGDTKEFLDKINKSIPSYVPTENGSVLWLTTKIVYYNY